MKKLVKLTLGAGVVLGVAWCIPPVRIRLYRAGRDFQASFTQRERELREALLPETVSLAEVPKNSALDESVKDAEVFFKAD